jgi:MtrB/PioB family decaheme-associated outer membrane protein
MRVRNTLKFAIMASVCAVPLAAVAQDFELNEAPAAAKTAEPIYDNEFDIGFLGQSKSSAVFGRYNGLYNGGVDILADWRMRSRDDYKSGGTNYFDFTGRDLSFGFRDNFDLAPNSSIDLKVGQQGTWGVNAGWDAMTYVQSNNFAALYNKNGTTNGQPEFTALPAGATATLLSGTVEGAYTQNSLIGTRRDKGTLGGSYTLGDWQFASGLTHEHKQGTLENSIALGGNGGGFASFAQPVNYDTDRFDLSASFVTPRLQAKLAYSFSNFRDNQAGFYFESLEEAQASVTRSSSGAAISKTTTTVTLNGVVDPLTGTYALPPSNMAHQLSGQVGYNINSTTRVNANATYGLQLQNQGFDPATTTAGQWAFGSNAALLGSNPSSLNGIVQTLFGNLAITTRPMPKMDLRASYTVDDRQSDTGNRNLWGDARDSAPTQSTVVSAGAGAPGPVVTTSTGLTFRTAESNSWVKQTANAEAGYRVLPSTKVVVGYNYRQVDRTDAITAQTKENEGYIKISSTFAEGLTGSLRYNHSDRTASDPNYSFWNSQTGSDCGDSVAGSLKCAQIPFYEASRIQDAVQGRLTAVLGDDASASLYGKFENDHYGANTGVTEEYKISAGPDMNYRLSSDAAVHTFGMYQRVFRGIATDGGTSPGTSGNQGGSAQVASTDDTYTAGIGGAYKVSDKLKVGAEYVFSYGEENIFETGYWNSGAPSLLPNVTTMDNSVKLNADYEFVPGVDFLVGYAFDRFTMNDWAMWGTTNGNVGNSTTSGQGNPNYNVHTVTSRVAFKW